MKKHWIMPLIVLAIGIALLAFQNYKEASTPPSDSWSRETDVGTTTVRSGIDAIQTEEGTYRIAYFKENALVERTYDENLNKTGEQETSVSGATGSEVFISQNRTLYSTGGTIYQTGSQEPLVDSEIFRPLENGIIYLSGGKVVYVDAETLQETTITENVPKAASVHAYEAGEVAFVSISEADDNHISTTIYRRQGDEVSILEEMESELSPSLKMEEVYPLVTSGKPQLLVSAVPAFQRSASGEKDFYLANKEENLQTLSRISFTDPVSGSLLEEIEDLKVIAKGEEASVLFRAQGFTETKTSGSEAFNVYEGVVEEGEMSSVRLSNTPRLSVKPATASEEVIAWLDIGAERNTVFMAASVNQAGFPSSALTWDTALRTAGKTLTMLSTGLMTIFLTVMWYAPPLLLMGAWTFRRRNPFDEEKEWSFYASVGFYTAVALLFHQHLFKAQVIGGLPEFLGFTGSPFVIILFFSLIALVIVKLSDLDKWWGIPGRVAYFIGMHILFMTVFIGPYIF
ncbi:hypothetical protein [Salimicrobium halophilum]|uniref:Uncharacterized protein n=1 Tax=Salimicrobium halophilum TaxID=86666 RepID=A0A1G8T840_9BACI|nr:hypothetical protein [Salimicrobium halophilum]SDJ37736.1 hypothetical protein SAMN04490247_1761 [Salimicrobium halophilum]